jgi:RNA recognition motif-containing protein
MSCAKDSGEALSIGANLSRGFGFVEFDSPATTRSVRRGMQGKDLEGRSLILEVSSKSKGDKGDKADGRASPIIRFSSPDVFLLT